jgi:hypothetical protein
MIRTLQFASGACLALVAAAGAFAQPHQGDVWLCVSAAGQLKYNPLGFNPDDPLTNIIVLPTATGLLHGWSSNSPGFDDVEQDDPAHDAYTFANGGFIRLDVLALDPALLVWNTGFQMFPPGTSAALGSTDGDVHTHLIWHIRSDTAAFDPNRTFWRGTFRLIDTGSTAYTPSAPFTLYFSRVFCGSADVNNDGSVDFFDIDPFLLVLFSPVSATDVQRCAADVNRDGAVDFFDIDPFLNVLFE